MYLSAGKFGGAARHALQLCAWLAFSGAVTQFPFDYQVAGLNRLESPWPSEAPNATEVLLNLLLFVPFGAWHMGRHSGRAGRGIAFAGAMGLLVSAAIELLQAFLPTRDMSMVDVVSNSGGALAGAWLRRWCGEATFAGLVRARARVSTGALVMAMLLIAIAEAAGSGALQLRSRLTNWSTEYPFIVGNELSGDRPWRGRLRRVTMTDAATSADEMRRFAERGDVAMPGRHVVDLHFSGPAPYHDRAGVVPPLRWTADGDAPPAGVFGVALDGSPLQSERPAAALPGFLQASNALTLRVVCASDDLAQGGPARIVSNSMDIGLRNFTVGQQAANLVMRLRMPHTGLNGARPEVVVPEVFTDTRMQDILITYDGARMLIAVARSGRVEQTEFTPGSSLALQLTSLSIQARELPALGAVFVGALFFVPGVVLGLFGRERRVGVISVVWLLSFAALLEGALAIASGRSFSWENATANGALGGLAFAVGVLICPPVQRTGGDVIRPSATSIPERSTCS